MYCSALLLLCAIVHGRELARKGRQECDFKHKFEGSCATKEGLAYYNHVDEYDYSYEVDDVDDEGSCLDWCCAQSKFLKHFPRPFACEYGNGVDGKYCMVMLGDMTNIEGNESDFGNCWVSNPEATAEATTSAPVATTAAPEMTTAAPVTTTAAAETTTAAAPPPKAAAETTTAAWAYIEDTSTTPADTTPTFTTAWNSDISDTTPASTPTAATPTSTTPDIRDTTRASTPTFATSTATTSTSTTPGSTTTTTTEATTTITDPATTTTSAETTVTADTCTRANCDGDPSTDWDCCSSTNQCSYGEGDCDVDKDCDRNLHCGSDNCLLYHSHGNSLWGSSADCCTSVEEKEITAMELSDNGGAVITDIGQENFNYIFNNNPLVKYTRNGKIKAFYKRISEVPIGFDAYTMFTYTWSSTNNQLHTDFKIYGSLEDMEAEDNDWQFCNFNIYGIGFPRECGPYGAVYNEWFVKPGKNYTSRGLTKGASLQLFAGVEAKKLGNWTNDGDCAATGEDKTCGPGVQKQKRTCTHGTKALCTDADLERIISCVVAGTALPACVDPRSSTTTVAEVTTTPIAETTTATEAAETTTAAAESTTATEAAETTVAPVGTITAETPTAAPKSKTEKR